MREGTLCKNMFKHVAYFILSIILLCSFIGLVMDINKKYDQEVDKMLAKVENCKQDYAANYCDDPVP